MKGLSCQSRVCSMSHLFTLTISFLFLLEDGDNLCPLNRLLLPPSPLAKAISIASNRSRQQADQAERGYREEKRKTISKMSVIDILTRVDAICKKYDKYDVDKLNASNVSGDDAFARLYASIESDIDSAVQVSLSLSLSLHIYQIVLLLSALTVSSIRGG